jgi:hypothetical protein
MQAELDLETADFNVAITQRALAAATLLSDRTSLAGSRGYAVSC